MAKEIKKNEFRPNNSKEGKGHPTYIYAQEGKEYKFIGITHAEITEGVRNIPLEENPEPGNNSQAYIRPKPQKEHRSSFGGKLKGWFFSPSDKEKVNAVIKNKNKKEKRK